MNPDEFPDPMLIEKLAEEESPKVPLRDYLSAMQTLRSKRYSYQEIADWLGERIGAEVTRSQVSYYLNAPADVLEAEEMQERIEDHDENQK